MRKKILAYLMLYRADVAFISFFCYLLGALFADGLETLDLLVAFLVSIISLNFVYCINSWADAQIDKINKPNRPMAKGIIKPKDALAYCSLLLALSLLWPYSVFGLSWHAHIFLVFPIGGLLYSVEPFRFKRNHILSLLLASIVLILPLSSGYLVNRGSQTNVPYIFSIFLYALAILPLKDIEDVKGDSAFHCKNWFALLGRQKLLFYSLAVLLLNLCATLLMPATKAKIYVSVLIIGTMIIVAHFFFRQKSDIRLLYRQIISFVMAYVFISFASFYFL
ncbi:MAG: UbiA family prenyltransferase [Candidatus Diapherotrites archaeon]